MSREWRPVLGFPHLLSRRQAAPKCGNLRACGAAPVDLMVTYVRDSDHITLEIPQFFEQFPPEQKNLAYKVNCHSRCGGIIIPYPLAVRIVEGI